MTLRTTHYEQLRKNYGSSSVSRFLEDIEHVGHKSLSHRALQPHGRVQQGVSCAIRGEGSNSSQQQSMENVDHCLILFVDTIV